MLQSMGSLTIKQVNGCFKMSGQKAWYSMEFIDYFFDMKNKDNKWNKYFSFEKNQVDQKDLKEQFEKEFDYPLIDNFICAFKYWQEKAQTHT